MCRPTFYIIFHNLYGARQVFSSAAREKFRVDIDKNAIRYYFRIFFFFSFYFVYTSAYNLVSMFVCVIVVKVTECMRRRVKLNYL